MSILVLHGHNPEDIRAWDELVERAPQPDVYYRPGYVRAYALSGHGRPLALVICSGSTRALFPLLIREIEFEGKTARDAITPYGYGGLLRLSEDVHVEPSVAHDLLSQLRNWAAASGLMACTLRLHPLFNQDAYLAGAETSAEWIRLFPRGQTTGIQLNSENSLKDNASAITKGRRYDLKRARSCLQVQMCTGPDATDQLAMFRPLYRESMGRVHANEFFFFPDAYYAHLAKELGDKLAIFTALANDIPVASAIFLADHAFVHYHLAASNDEGRRFGAATLLVFRASEWARERGCSLLHLGGGLKDDDSLLAFKRSFGGDTYSYSYITLVADDEQYRHLSGHAEVPWPYTDVPHPTGDAGTERRSQTGRDSAAAAHTSKTRVVGIGAGGHAKVIMDILSYSPDIRVVGLVELATRLLNETLEGGLILGDDDVLPRLLAEGVDSAFIGIGGVGNNTPRARAFERILDLGFNVIRAIHPRAVVASSAQLGRGVCIMAGAVVNPAALIGDNVILNTHCTVEHDCVIGDHVHIAPGATLSGGVQVGRLSHIGTGASIRQGVRIGERAIIGVGSVVVRDVPDDVIVAGTPARSLKVASFEP